MSPGIMAGQMRTATGPASVTLDPVAMAAGGVLSNGNLTLSRTVGTTVCARATRGATSGLLYFEATLDVKANSFSPAVGLQTAAGDLTTDLGQETAEYGLRADGSIYRSADFTGGWDSASAQGAVIMVAVDFTGKKIWFGRNGVWLGSGDPVAGTNASATFTTASALFPAVQVNSTAYVTIRFQPASFSYAPPSGFSPW